MTVIKLRNQFKRETGKTWDLAINSYPAWLEKKILEMENPWQPIETAPKTGECILVAVAGSENYYPDKAWWAGEWITHVSFLGIRTVLTVPPTHWQELPKSPEK